MNMVVIPPWTEEFLRHLQRTGLPASAARAAGTTLKKIEEWRQQSEEFAEAYNTTLELNIDEMEATARNRAINGWEEPVFYKGYECGTVRKFDNGLLRWLIEGNRDRYSPKVKHTGHDGGPLTVTIRNFNDLPAIDAEFTDVTDLV